MCTDSYIRSDLCFWGNTGTTAARRSQGNWAWNPCFATHVCRTIVCTADNDGGNGISEYWRETVGKLWILSAKRATVYSDTTNFKKYPGDFRSTGSTAFILCIYIYCVYIPLQNLFEASAGIKKLDHKAKLPSEIFTYTFGILLKRCLHMC